VPAFLLGLASIGVLVVMDALIKHLALRHGAPALVAMRFAAAVLWLLPVVMWLRMPWPGMTQVRAHGLRAAMMLVSNACFFHALGTLPFADVFTLSFLAPIFVTAFGVVILGERPGVRTMAALALGCLGMVITVRGGLDAAAGGSAWPLHGLAAGLAAPLLYALSITLLKAQAGREPAAVIVLTQSALAAAMAGPVAAVSWVWPTGEEWRLIGIVGALSAAGYLMLVHALAGMSSVRYGVVEYSGLIWAATLGYVAFNEAPGVHVWLGAAAIIAGCLILAMQKDEARSRSAAG
jgi:S-adenosylmethionine uptake transporter